MIMKQGRIFDAGRAEEEAIVTYKVTGSRSAVVETLFPGTPSALYTTGPTTTWARQPI
jgi:hypothetical protein